MKTGDVGLVAQTVKPLLGTPVTNIKVSGLNLGDSASNQVSC